VRTDSTRATRFHDGLGGRGLRCVRSITARRPAGPITMDIQQTFFRRDWRAGPSTRSGSHASSSCPTVLQAGEEHHRVTLYDTTLVMGPSARECPVSRGTAAHRSEARSARVHYIEGGFPGSIPKTSSLRAFGRVEA